MSIINIFIMIEIFMYFSNAHYVHLILQGFKLLLQKAENTVSKTD